MVTPTWACMACLLLLSLGVSSAYRDIGGQKDPKVVDKPDNFVLGGHIRGGMGLKPGFHIGGIIEGVLGLGDKRRPQSPSQSPRFGAGATGVGYGGGQGGGYGGGGSCGGGQGGGSCGGQGGGSSGDQGGGNCGDQSGGDSGGQAGGIVNIPSFTIPGFDIGGIIGGGISTGSSGLYCTPIDCPSNNCKGVRLYFDNSNMAPSETTAASNGQKQTMNHGMEDKHIMDTLASEPVPSSSLASEPSNSLAPEPSDGLAPAPESG